MKEISTRLDQIRVKINNLENFEVESMFREAQQSFFSTDYYVFMFVIQMSVLLMCLMFYPSIDPRYTLEGLGSYVSLNNSITSSYVEIMYLLAIMLCFSLIIVDRFLYLCTNNAMKYFFQIAWCLVFHFCMLYEFKMQADVDTNSTRNWILFIYYFSQALYFFVSAKQIRTGYKERDAHGEFLLRFHMDSNYNLRPGKVIYFTFQIYRLIPFMFEIRAVLDWWCIPTSLDFYEWFKVADLQATLFKNAYLRHAERGNDERYVGQIQPGWYKHLAGGLVFLALLAVIWGPLLIFSSASPVLASNEVTQLESTISLVLPYATLPMWTQRATEFLEVESTSAFATCYARSNSLATAETKLFLADLGSVSQIRYTTPKAFADILQDYVVGSASVVELKITHKVDTVSSDSSTSIYKPLETYVTLTTEEITRLKEISQTIYALDFASTSTETMTRNSTFQDSLIANSAGSPAFAASMAHNLVVNFHTNQNELWWSFSYESSDYDTCTRGPDDYPPEWDRNANATRNELEMLIWTDPVPTGVFADSAYNLSGLYILLFFTVGTLVRGALKNIGDRAIFEDMEDVRYPVRLCASMSRCRELHVRGINRGTKGWRASLSVWDNIKYFIKTQLGMRSPQEQADLISRMDYLTVEHQLYIELIKLYRRPDKLYEHTTVSLDGLPSENRELFVDGKKYLKGVWSQPQPYHSGFHKTLADEKVAAEAARAGKVTDMLAKVDRSDLDDGLKEVLVEILTRDN